MIEELLFLLVVCSKVLPDQHPRRTDEARVVHHLLRELNQVQSPHIIPRWNTKQPLNVKFGLRLVKASLNEKDNVLDTSVWVRYKWKDVFLTWNRSDFGGVDRVVMPTSRIWTPDITLVNTAETIIPERDSEGAAISHRGNIFWCPHRHYQSACLVNLTNYPFDSHTCDLWFQSLVNPDWDLNPQIYGPSPPFDLDTYITSFKTSGGLTSYYITPGEWILNGNESIRVNRSRDHGVRLVFSRRTSLRFRLILTRQPGFTAYLLMIPPLLLSALNLIVFCLPPERPDRNALATSLFGSFMVLLLVLVQTAPPSAASIPKLGIFYVISMMLIMLSVGLSASVSWIRARKGDVPKYLKKIMVEKMGALLFLCAPPVIPPFKSVPSTPSPGVQDKDDITKQKGNSMTSDANGHTSLWVDETLQQRLNRLNNRISMLERSNVKQPQDRRVSGIPAMTDWMLLGVVLDRIFILLYILIIIVNIVLFFPRPSM